MPSSPHPPTPLEFAVRAALDRIVGADGRGLIASGRIAGLVVRADGRVGFVLETEAGAADEPLRAAAEAAVRAVPGVVSVTAVLTGHDAGESAPASAARRSRIEPSGPGRPGRSPAPPTPSPVSGARGAAPAREQDRLAYRTVAVASAKGGVGKSTVAVNLAVAAARSGRRVGLLDLDVFGPSLPTMMGATSVRAQVDDAGRLAPVEAFGVATMSIGYLVDPAQAIAWRGPMVMSAVNQLTSEVGWGDIDILFIDTPPGTGEVQLSLLQKLALDGAVIVSTPQELALADVRRGVAMFRKTAARILGVVENMAWLELPDGTRLYPFGQGGAERTARELNAPFLGALPMLADLREGGDIGRPAAAGEGVAAQAFALLAEAVCEAAQAGGKPPPRIVFE